MAHGICLSIGLNSVDPEHYNGWSGDLNACEADARDVGYIATSMGLETHLLLTADATRAKVVAAIASAAAKLKAGDLFVLAYSGHGGQLPDLDDDEFQDALDETWCFYDGQFVDDEIFVTLGAFATGVRVFSLSDSCHSGTVLKMNLMSVSPGGNAAGRFKAIPPSVASSTYLKNKPFYDAILTDKKLKKAKDKMKASAILISGCMDNQLSADGAFNGRFTGQMKKVWNGGKFKGGYKAFWKQILANMPPDQTPNFFTVGPPNPAFEAMKPFKI